MKRRALKESVCVITGASSGIGRASAVELARRGAVVVPAARRKGAIEEVAAECGGHGRALAVQVDVTKEESVRALVEAVMAAFGRIDIWINNAAVTSFGRFEEMPREVFRRVIETNLIGYAHGAWAVLPYMREQGQGLLINVGSPVGVGATPYVSAYSASKFAVRGLTESLRGELKGSGIDICSVLPASTDTPLFHQAANYSGRGFRPLHPVLAPEQVARVIADVAERPRREIFAGAGGRVGALVHGGMPSIYEWAVRNKTEREHFAEERAAETGGNLYEPLAQYATVSGGWRQPRAGQGLRMTANAVKAAGAVIGLLLLGNEARRRGWGANRRRSRRRR